ncbi:hypothetical protein SAICODRAFT_26155 [Saitoella complicata NRRL Y-17804]|uniref:uncharacterized protein n=1 Tax=Saitoella complicata (strain BCRC 22490 / CBS 7301 / JCM 7358 / NBRC 10748 / NRRL Y-17804) TaxID=698492 RepID=UPI0008668595|nr:uncharacterized protein SAICODRAFT_26155 [Saitoella complicata NRRL Y-17804]ODQ52093.1 hypothetical protein SAICODRAFT_26155 [Saitoella complicata NRRL Y-17804]
MPSVLFWKKKKTVSGQQQSAQETSSPSRLGSILRESSFRSKRNSVPATPVAGVPSQQLRDSSTPTLGHDKRQRKRQSVPASKYLVDENQQRGSQPLSRNISISKSLKSRKESMSAAPPPTRGSVMSSMSQSPSMMRALKVRSLDLVKPSPTLRFMQEEPEQRPLQSQAPGSHVRAQSEGIILNQVLPKQHQHSKSTGTVDGIADTLGAKDLRSLMEREERRRAKRVEEAKERQEQRRRLRAEVERLQQQEEDIARRSRGQQATFMRSGSSKGKERAWENEDFVEVRSQSVATQTPEAWAYEEEGEEAEKYAEDMMSLAMPIQPTLSEEAYNQEFRSSSRTAPGRVSSRFRESVDASESSKSSMEGPSAIPAQDVSAVSRTTEISAERRGNANFISTAWSSLIRRASSSRKKKERDMAKYKKERAADKATPEREFVVTGGAKLSHEGGSPIMLVPHSSVSGTGGVSKSRSKMIQPPMPSPPPTSPPPSSSLYQPIHKDFVSMTPAFSGSAPWHESNEKESEGSEDSSGPVTITSMPFTPAHVRNFSHPTREATHSDRERETLSAASSRMDRPLSTVTDPGDALIYAFPAVPQRIPLQEALSGQPRQVILAEPVTDIDIDEYITEPRDAIVEPVEDISDTTPQFNRMMNADLSPEGTPLWDSPTLPAGRDYEAGSPSDIRAAPYSVYSTKASSRMTSSDECIPTETENVNSKTRGPPLTSRANFDTNTSFAMFESAAGTVTEDADITPTSMEDDGESALPQMKTVSAGKKPQIVHNSFSKLPVEPTSTSGTTSESGVIVPRAGRILSRHGSFGEVQ